MKLYTYSINPDPSVLPRQRFLTHCYNIRINGDKEEGYSPGIGRLNHSSLEKIFFGNELLCSRSLIIRGATKAAVLNAATTWFRGFGSFRVHDDRSWVSMDREIMYTAVLYRARKHASHKGVSAASVCDYVYSLFEKGSFLSRYRYTPTLVQKINGDELFLYSTSSTEYITVNNLYYVAHGYIWYIHTICT